MRLPSRIATRSPDFSPSLWNPPAMRCDCWMTSRQLIRLSPQTSASAAGFFAAARATMSQILPGRSENTGTTRSPKRCSSRIAGIENFDQSILHSNDGHADHDRMEREGECEIGDDPDDHRDRVVGEAADGNRRRTGVCAMLKRNPGEHPPVE